MQQTFMRSTEAAPRKPDQPADAAPLCAVAPVPVDGDTIPDFSADREFAATLDHRSPLIAPGPESDSAAAAPAADALPSASPEPGSNLFVAGLAPAVDDAALEQAFSKFGRIMSAKVMLHVDTAVSRRRRRRQTALCKHWTAPSFLDMKARCRSACRGTAART